MLETKILHALVDPAHSSQIIGYDGYDDIHMPRVTFNCHAMLIWEYCQRDEDPSSPLAATVYLSSFMFLKSGFLCLARRWLPVDILPLHVLQSLTITWIVAIF